MLSDYIAALLALQRTRDLAQSALPNAPVQPDIERGKIDQDCRAHVPLRPADRVACPCGRWELSRYDRDAWLGLCRHLFPQLDLELDVWEHAHGWLYR
jgi:hypothetical protein